MLGRFLIHTFQKYLLKIKVGLNNVVILFELTEEVWRFIKFRRSNFSWINVKGFIQSSDDPKSFKNDITDSKKIGNEFEINEQSDQKIDDVIIALEKTTLKE